MHVIAGLVPATPNLETEQDNRGGRERSGYGIEAANQRQKTRAGRPRSHITSSLLRVGRLVEALDLGVSAQLGHEVGLGLPRCVFFDLAPDLVERWRLAQALVLDLQHVP